MNSAGSRRQNLPTPAPAISFRLRANLLVLFLLLPCVVHAQQEDETRVTSPDGKVEFRLFTARPEGALWARVGYQLWYEGKPLLTTSWLGIDIRDQEPYLAENPGFMYADKKANSAGGYNSEIAHYMQNGSLGRRLDVEIRAFNDGVAFRYILPPSTPLIDFLVRDDKTECNFADAAVLNGLPSKSDYDVPVSLSLASGRFVEITSAPAPGQDPKFPPTYLVRTPTGLMTTLARSKTELDAVYAATTPLVWPWRIVSVAAQPDAQVSPAVLQ